MGLACLAEFFTNSIDPFSMPRRRREIEGNQVLENHPYFCRFFFFSRRMRIISDSFRIFIIGLHFQEIRRSETFVTHILNV